MADKNEIGRLELDTKPIVDALRMVQQTIGAVQKQLEKPIVVKVDDKQLKGLIKSMEGMFTSLGRSIRGAMQMSTDAIVASVEEANASIKSMTAVSDAAVTSIINMGQAGKTAGKALGDGIKDEALAGLKATSNEITRFEDELNATMKKFWQRRDQLRNKSVFDSRLSAQGASISPDYLAAKTPGEDGTLFVSREAKQVIENSFKDLEIETKALIGTMKAGEVADKELAKSQLAAAHLNDLRNKLRNQNVSAVAPETLLTNVNGEHAFNTSLYRQLESALRARIASEAVVTAATKEGESRQKHLNTVEEQAANAFYNLQASISKLRNPGAFRQANNVPEAPFNPSTFITGSGDNRKLDVALVQRLNQELKTTQQVERAIAENLDREVSARKKSTSEADRANKQLKDANLHSRNILNNQQSIGMSIAETAIRMGKWLVFYRLVRDTMMVVERSITTFVERGIEYTRQQELQQIGLRAVLSENFKVTDSQGRQLEGAAKMNSLQSVALKQWRELQSTSLAVVGTTEDLMTLYNSILPFALRLKASLSDVQQLTKSTAIAASVLDVSFSDARSAMVGLLQGRALTRNRLVGILGITPDEIKTLKGTPELFKRIQDALDSFNDVADDSQNTLAAISESFKDFIGIIGAEAIKPFIASFKTAVNGIRDLLFVQNASGGFRLKDEVAGLFGVIRSELGQILTPMQGFGKSLREQSDNIPLWVNSAAKLATTFVTLLTALASLALGFATFVSQNRMLVQGLIYLAAAMAVVGLFRGFQSWLIKTADAGGVLGNVIRMLVLQFPALSTQLKVNEKGMEGAATAAKSGAAAMAGFKASVMGILASTAIGLLAVGIGVLIEKFLAMADAANKAKEAKLAALGSDTFDSLSKSAELIKDPDLDQQNTGLAALGQHLGPLAKRLGDIKIGDQSAGLDSSNFLEKYRDFTKQLKDLSDERVKLLHKLDTASSSEKASLAQQIKNNRAITADIKAAMGEVAPLVNDFRAYSANGLRLAQQSLRDNEAGLASEQAKGRVKGFIAGGSGDSAASSIAKQQNDKIDENIKKYKRNIETAKEAIKYLQQFHTDSVRAQDDIENTGDILTANPVKEPAPKKEGQGFVSDTEEVTQTLKANLDLRRREVNAALKAREIDFATHAKKMDDLEREEAESIVVLRESQLGEFQEFLKKMEAQGTPKSPQYIAQETQRINAAIQKAKDEATARGKELDADGVARAREFNEAATDFELEIKKKRAEALDEVGNEVDASLDKFIVDMRTRLQSLDIDAATKDQIRKVLGMAENLRGVTTSKAEVARSLTDVRSRVKDLGDQEQLLNQRFQVGRLTVAEYIKQLHALREATAEAIKSQIALLAQDRARLMTSTHPNMEAVRAIDAEARELQERLEKLLSPAERVKVAMDAFTRMGSRLGSVLAPLQQMTDRFEVLGSTIKGAFEEAKNFIGLVRDIRAFIAAFEDLRTKSSATGGTSMLASVGGLVGGLKSSSQPAFGGIQMNGRSTASGPAAAGGGISAAAGTIMAVAGVAGMAIGIASALYARAVKKAEDQIKKSFDNIAKSAAAGEINVAQQLSAMERERARLQAEMSKSKSGRAALKEMLPDIDAQIEEVKNKIAEVRKTFEDQLKTARLGNGPFADFAKTLLDLEMRTKQYLDTFEEGSAEYAAALKNVTELFNITLKEAKEQLESNSLGFNQEALADAQKVIDLVDSQADLYQQLSDIADQKAELDDQQAENNKERIDEEKKALKDREDRVKKILDLEKQIMDITRKAAEDESAIRRRGVLEAQETIAQQKAREISQVRYDARNQIEELRQQIAELQAEGAGDDTLDKIAKDFAKKQTAIDKQRQALDKQAQKANQEIRLNAIRLNAARQIAALEGQVYDITGDRYEIARKAADLEVAQASIRVKQWKDTKELIQSIIDMGNGDFEFKPPPGFPQIKVSIGTINIDNSSSSTTNGSDPSDPQRPTPTEPRPREPRPRPPKENGDTEVSTAGRVARVQGYGDVSF